MKEKIEENGLGEINLNERAYSVFEEIVERRKELKVEYYELENGAKVVCSGFDGDSFSAGLYFARICTSDLARFEIEMKRIGSLLLPCISMQTSFPYEACLKSQKAGWSIKSGDFFGLASGPAQLLKGGEEESDKAVVFIESSKKPDKKVAEHIASECGIEAQNLAIACSPTASLAGAVQIAARGVETALYRIETLELNFRAEEAFGLIPIAPIIGGDEEMMGLTNDMIIYGSRIVLFGYGNESEDKLKLISSDNSKSYGKSFLEIFIEAGKDFYKMDKEIFAPAEVIINDIGSGKIFKFGRINESLLEHLIKDGKSLYNRRGSGR